MLGNHRTWCSTIFGIVDQKTFINFTTISFLIVRAYMCFLSCSLMHIPPPSGRFKPTNSSANFSPCRANPRSTVLGRLVSLNGFPVIAVISPDENQSYVGYVHSGAKICWHLKRSWYDWKCGVEQWHSERFIIEMKDKGVWSAWTMNNRIASGSNYLFNSGGLILIVVQSELILTFRQTHSSIVWMLLILSIHA